MMVIHLLYSLPPSFHLDQLTSPFFFIRFPSFTSDLAFISFQPFLCDVLLPDKKHSQQNCVLEERAQEIMLTNFCELCRRTDSPTWDCVPLCHRAPFSRKKHWGGFFVGQSVNTSLLEMNAFKSGSLGQGRKFVNILLIFCYFCLLSPKTFTR